MGECGKMLVSEINNRADGLAFAGKAKMIRALTKPERPVALTGDLYEQLSSIVSVFDNLHTSLNRLRVQKDNDNAQKLLQELQKNFGIREIFETKAEGLTLAGDAKNILVSTHGYNSLRLREQNPKNGKIENTLFFHNGKYVKTNVSSEVPTSIEYFRNKEIDNPARFRLGVREKFDEVDFSLLKLRRAMLSPEIQAEVKKADPEKIRAEVIKTLVVKTPEPQAQSPKPKLKSYYQKMLEEQRAKRALKPYTTQFNGVVVMEKREEKTLIDVMREQAAAKKNSKPALEESKPAQEIVSEPLTAPVQKRRGRPPKNKNAEPPAESHKVRFLTPQSAKGILKKEDFAFVSELRDSYGEIFKNLHSIKNNVTRTKIKNSYGDTLEKGSAGSRALNFIGIGPDAENLSINMFSYQAKPHLILTDASGKLYIINPRGQVMKTPPLVMSRTAAVNVGSSNRVRYYTQEELKQINFSEKFAPLKEELKHYNDFILKKIELLKNKKGRRAKSGDSLDAEKVMVKQNAKTAAVAQNEIIASLQKTLNDFQNEFTKQLEAVSAEIESFTQKRLTQLQQEAANTIDALKQKLSAIMKPTD